MIRRPPRSTLLPTATLFRSRRGRPVHRPAVGAGDGVVVRVAPARARHHPCNRFRTDRSEEHTSELQSRQYLVCRLLLEKTTRTHPHVFVFILHSSTLSP